MLKKIQEINPQEILHALKRHPIFAGLVVLLSVGIVVVFMQIFSGDHSDALRERRIKVEVDTARLGSISRKVNAVGSLVANQTVTVKAQVRGLVTAINTEGGKEIPSGAAIITLDDREYKARLKDAEGKLVFAKSEFNRADSLASQKFGATKTRDEKLAKFLEAEAAVELAKKNLDDTVIRAPFEGVVSLNSIAVGSPVNEQTELFTVVDVDPIKLDFRVPSEYLRSLSVGQKIMITIDGFEDTPFKAEIEAIDAKVDASAHSILVRALIPNEKRLLKPGLFGRVSLNIGTKDNVVIVPRVAVETSGEESYVFTVFQGFALKRRVTVGLEEGENVEIVEGIKEGELVITTAFKVHDRYPVTYAGFKDANAKEEPKPEPAKEAPKKDAVTAETPKTEAAATENAEIKKPAEEKTEAPAEAKPASDADGAPKEESK